MKILKFKKNNNGLYTIFLDNDSCIELYQEVILKYDILITKEITLDEYNTIIKDNKNYECIYCALKLINRRLKTKMEIKEYLKGKEYSSFCIDNALTYLEKNNYVNDVNYASSYIHNAIATTIKGPKKIFIELKKKGISEDICFKALEEYDLEIEKEKIKILIEKKIKSNHNKSVNKLKQKIMSDAINNGFHQDIAKSILNNTYFEEDKEIAKKEYDKYYRILSKKYSGSMLEYKLRQKMYSLGFINKD